MTSGVVTRAGLCGCVLAIVLLAGCSGGDAGAKEASEPSRSAAQQQPTSKSTTAPTAGSPTSSASQPAAPAKRTKPVPAPSGGDISEVIAPHVVATADPVALTRKASVEKGVIVSITSVKPIKVGAAGPGEIAGKAVAVTVDVKNGGAASLDLTSAVVTALRDDGSPLLPTTSGPYAPFSSKVEPGSRGTATYVFLESPPVDGDVHVLVSCTPDLATAQFVGPLA